MMGRREEAAILRRVNQGEGRLHKDPKEMRERAVRI